MLNIDTVGSDWLIETVGEMVDHVTHVTPVEFNEANRYLPESVTSMPGPMSFDLNPFMKEVVNCFDINSDVREVNMKKGVQITYTTVLESGALYFMAHVKTLPMMYITAEKELAAARIENNFLPMLQHSDLEHIIRSSDEGNSRKTGSTANHLQFEGGGYMVPFGATNANKMRAVSICIMMKDEIDAWPDVVGKDGDPDSLSDDRCSGYWERRKIFRGSTPLLKGSSKIQKQYLLGDQRKYMVLCKHCKHEQYLKWSTLDKETGVVGGMQWDIEDGRLNLDTVRYCCSKCGGAHYEHDKHKLFATEHGAYWKPTTQPSQRGIRSYHLPAMYSPPGFAPWYKLVADYLTCYDPVARKVTDIGRYQKFYNNVLAEPFEILGAKIRFEQVSAHRRTCYRLGQIPNVYAMQYSGSKILMLTCQVDVQGHDLAVTVMGWTRGFRCYVIDYWRFETDGETSEVTDPVWQRLRDLIESKVYTADDGEKYGITVTLIDAGHNNATVIEFCEEYADSVIPILGRQRPGKNQTITEFGEFKTQIGTFGYKITVDHYKDRLGTSLRRQWDEEQGDQSTYHFNSPMDIEDKQLKELLKTPLEPFIKG